MSSGASLYSSQHVLLCNNLLHSVLIFLISEIAHLQFCLFCCFADLYAFSKFNSVFSRCLCTFSLLQVTSKYLIRWIIENVTFMFLQGKKKSFLQTAPLVCRIHESGFLFLSQRMKYKINIQSVVQKASVLIWHVQK